VLKSNAQLHRFQVLDEPGSFAPLSSSFASGPSNAELMSQMTQMNELLLFMDQRGSWR
jgi:hypothetical protein